MVITSKKKLVLIVVVIFFTFSGCQNQIDDSWIDELGYEEAEISELAFDWHGDRSCPTVPIIINGKTFDFTFDTGCGSGITLTNAIEDDIEFTVLDKVEQLNRDGSHRGWSKLISIDKMDVFGEEHSGIETTLAEWEMFSSKKFDGLIGLKYFDSRIVTLDYSGKRIGIKDTPIDYDLLDKEDYMVLPMERSVEEGQMFLPFVKARLKNEDIIVYIDTGKNYSFYLDETSQHTMGEKPKDLSDLTFEFAGETIELIEASPVNDMHQADGLDDPNRIEFNSDQIWKNHLIITFDLIEYNVILKKIVQ